MTFSPRRKSQRTVIPMMMFVILVTAAIIFSCDKQPSSIFEAYVFDKKSNISSIVSVSAAATAAASTAATTTTTSLATSDEENATTVSTLSFEPLSNITYPLHALNLESAREAYEKGFWQLADPVPLDRWQASANTTCIPHNASLPDWKRRVPYVILIGVQKGGTTALSYYLYNHPAVQYLPAKEFHYFDAELDQNPTILVNGSGIDARKVLDFYQDTIIGGMIPLVKFELEVIYALDATPNYMWLSDRVPHRIFCAAPWAKLLAILRNPVDRAFSQYHMQLHHDISNPESRRGYVSFDDYIAMDIKVLQDIGVLPKGYGGWNPTASKSPPDTPIDSSWLLSDQTIQAWAKYTKLGLNSPIGRGLYALQLRQWFDTMDLYNKPRSDLKVMTSQSLLHSPNETYAEILKFLKLQPYTLQQYSKIHTTQNQDETMIMTTRRKLQVFYEPFNRLLVDLLGSKEWKGIWESD